MGELKDRAKGAVDETVGKAKRALGDATDNPKLRAEGDIQEAKGDAEKALGKVKGALKD
jgi:uncharacterized protein YjbJ (UPF0337 family)